MKYLILLLLIVPFFQTVHGIEISEIENLLERNHGEECTIFTIIESKEYDLKSCNKIYDSSYNDDLHIDQNVLFHGDLLTIHGSTSANVTDFFIIISDENNIISKIIEPAKNNKVTILIDDKFDTDKKYQIKAGYISNNNLRNILSEEFYVINNTEIISIENTIKEIQNIINRILLVTGISIQGDVNGIVSDNNSPISGVKVTISDKVTFTNSDGKYSFSDVENGNYAILFTHDDYHIYTENITVSTAKTTTANITLASLPAQSELLELQKYMLNLINHERTTRGLNPVELGTNEAAQYHATSNLNNCVSGHWGVDGLKPYMRYSLFGGYQVNKENASGLDYCIKPWENYIETEPKRDVREAMEGLMDSPGHRENILDPHHKFVNIGLAWDNYNMFVIQHFEYHYASFSQLPTIENDTLSFSVNVINGATFSDSLVTIYFDPPPHELTRGQLASTYCTSFGSPVGKIQSPPQPGYHYTSLTYEKTITISCPNPYDISPNIPGPQSPQEAHNAYDHAKNNFKSTTETKTLPLIVADEWEETSNHLTISADISDILTEHGPGVYNVSVWGESNGESVIIGDYSIFHEIEPPIGYPD